MPVPKTTRKPKDEPTPESSNYISSKLGTILENIGSQYGESLQSELLNRMERTIADFNDEVNEMIEELQNRSLERQERLKNLVEQASEETTDEPVAETEEETTDEPAHEMSEWERRLEMLEKKK